jgi:hypothetical protein
MLSLPLRRCLTLLQRTENKNQDVATVAGTARLAAALPAYGQHSAASPDVARQNPTTCKPHKLASLVLSTLMRGM